MSKIRRPEVSELGALACLENAIFGNHGYSQLTLRQFYDLAGPLLVVAVDNRRLLGYGFALPSATPGEGWFMALGISAKYRKQGLGRKLAVAVMEQAASHEIHTLRLTVEPTNHAAIALYKSLGFAQESIMGDYFGPNEQRIVMCRRA